MPTPYDPNVDPIVSASNNTARQIIIGHEDALLSELNGLMASSEIRDHRDYLECTQLHFEKAEALALMRLLKAHKNLVKVDLSWSSWPASQLVKLEKILKTMPKLESLKLTDLILESEGQYFIYCAETRTLDEVNPAPNRSTSLKGDYLDSVLTAWENLCDLSQILASQYLAEGVSLQDCMSAHEAARLKLWPVLDAKLEHRRPLDSADLVGPYAGCTALWWAAWYDETDVVERMLASQSVDLFACATVEAFTGLNIPMIALLRDNMNLFEACMDDAGNRADFDFDTYWFDPRTERHQSILYLTVLRKEYMQFEFLWASGHFNATILPHLQAPTLLWLLAEDAQWDLCRRILKSDYNQLNYFPIEPKNIRFKTAMWWAAKDRQWGLVELFIQRGAQQIDLPPPGEQSVRALAERAQQNEINNLIEEACLKSDLERKLFSKKSNHDVISNVILKTSASSSELLLGAARDLGRATKDYVEQNRLFVLHQKSAEELKLKIAGLAPIKDSLQTKLKDAESLTLELSQHRALDRRMLQGFKHTTELIRHYLSVKGTSKKSSFNYMSDVRELDARYKEYCQLVEIQKSSLPRRQKFSWTTSLKALMDDIRGRNKELEAEREALTVNIGEVDQALQAKLHALNALIASQHLLMKKFGLSKQKPISRALAIDAASIDVESTPPCPLHGSNALDRDPLQAHLQTLADALASVQYAPALKISALKFACFLQLLKLSTSHLDELPGLQTRIKSFTRGELFPVEEADVRWPQLFDYLRALETESRPSATFDLFSTQSMLKAPPPSLAEIKSQLKMTFLEITELCKLAQANGPTAIARPWIHFALAFNLIRFSDNDSRLNLKCFASVIAQLKSNPAVSNLWDELLQCVPKLKLPELALDPFPVLTAHLLLKKSPQQYAYLYQAIADFKFARVERHLALSVHDVDEPYGLAELFHESPRKRVLNIKASIFVPRKLEKLPASSLDPQPDTDPPHSENRASTASSAQPTNLKAATQLQVPERQIRFLSFFSPRNQNASGRYQSPFALPFRGFRFEVVEGDPDAAPPSDGNSKLK